MAITDRILTSPHTNQENLEKKYGESPVFVASTLLEDGGVPKEASSMALTNEAIHVINCTYENKTDWGKEVSTCRNTIYLGKLLLEPPNI